MTALRAGWLVTITQWSFRLVINYLPGMDAAVPRGASGLWQIAQWIDRFAVLANLEVELGPVRAAVAHPGYRLTCLDMLAFPNQQFTVVAIGTQQTVRVLYNNKPAVADKSTACINNLAVRGCHHCLARPATDIDTLLAGVVREVTVEQLPLRRPDPLLHGTR